MSAAATPGGATRPRGSGLSLRAKLMAIVALGVFVPLTGVGVWTTKRLERSGEELLRTQLDSSLDVVQGVIQHNWNLRRGDLMLLADNEVIRQAVQEAHSRIGPAGVRFLRDAYAELEATLDGVVYHDARGIARWRVRPDPGLDIHVESVPPGTARPTSQLGLLAVTIPIAGENADSSLGSMTALLRLTAILPSPPALAAPGATFNVLDPRHRAPLLRWGRPRHRTPSSSDADTSRWLTVERMLASPPLVLTASAPTAPYVVPFEQSARRGLLVLLAALLSSCAVAAWLTARATRALERLAAAADAVAKGDFERKVDAHSSDEIGRVALAFNAMTDRLQRALREASSREALAAVGEFAAELAHEIRNPLTAVRLDLQRVAERLPPDGKLADPLRRALAAIDRLNRTVTGSLRAARSGQAVLEPVRLRAALEPAIQAAMPEFTARSVSLQHDAAALESVWVRGNTDALTQLFLNILLNAAEAVDRAGQVSISTAQENGQVTVTVTDTGPGMAAETLRRIGEPFHTTKPGGTGLGLTIARRIATAHGGTIDFAKGTTGGTAVRISLPREGARHAASV